MFTFIRKSRLQRLEWEVARLSREVLYEYIGVCSSCSGITFYTMGPKEALLKEKGDKCGYCMETGFIKYRPNYIKEGK